MRLFKKEIKPCSVEMFASNFPRYVLLEDKWYSEDDKEVLIEKWQDKLPSDADRIDFKERLVELPDRVSISVEEYLEWKRYKQAVYEDLYG